MVNTEKCLILSHVLHIVEAIEIIIWVIMGLVIVGIVFPAGSAPKSDNIFLSALTHIGIGSTVLGFYILFVAIFSIFAVAYKRRVLLKISAVLVFIMMVLMEYSTHSILTIMICNDDRER